METMAVSVVPPPTSTTMLPTGSYTGRPAPMAAASGFSTRITCLPPALTTASVTTLRATAGRPAGTQMSTRGLLNRWLTPMALRIKYFSSTAAVSKSWMAPSRMGRMACSASVVRPNSSAASSPTARTRCLSLASTTTMVGSLITMPLRFT